MLHAENFQHHAAHFPLFSHLKESHAVRRVKEVGLPHSIPEAISLRLFGDLPVEYDPSTWWLDGHRPDHPHFDEAWKIHLIAKTIKDPLLNCIIAGCKLLLEQTSRIDLIPTLDHHHVLWRACISLHKYGVVYLGTRAECRNEFLPALVAKPDVFESIDAFLRTDHNLVRTVNYGVHRFVVSGLMTVDHPGKLIPPNAISSIDLFHVAVRPQDFEGSSVDRLSITTPLWDLHDFAHHAVTSLCPRLFGSKYFTHLARLPTTLTALIRSPGMKTGAPKVKFSDGIVFSELLTPLFAKEVETDPTHTYASLTATLAQALAEYLQGRRELQHLSTGTQLRASAPIDASQLAVLAQNKAYELTASEIEQRIMTRGGGAGDSRDELDPLTAAERVQFLARCRRWMYFEVRNTIKHRAHKRAYRLVAEAMLAEVEPTQDRDANLLRLTLDALHYKGWESDSVPNLWETLIEEGV